MSEYIKRDAVLQIISDAPRYYLNDMIRADAMRDNVKRLPAADVVEVVRCKDCRYATLTYDGKCKYCEMLSPEEEAYYPVDFYCAYGERSDYNE